MSAAGLKLHTHFVYPLLVVRNFFFEFLRDSRASK